jgi:hypothetical protein
VFTLLFSVVTMSFSVNLARLESSQHSLHAFNVTGPGARASERSMVKREQRVGTEVGERVGEKRGREHRGFIIAMGGGE